MATPQERYDRQLEGMDVDKQRELNDERYARTRLDRADENFGEESGGNVYNTVNEDHSSTEQVEEEDNVSVRESREDVIGTPIVSEDNPDNHPQADGGEYNRAVDPDTDSDTLDSEGLRTRADGPAEEPAQEGDVDEDGELQ